MLEVERGCAAPVEATVREEVDTLIVIPTALQRLSVKVTVSSVWSDRSSNIEVQHTLEICGIAFVLDDREERIYEGLIFTDTCDVCELATGGGYTRECSCFLCPFLSYFHRQRGWNFHAQHIEGRRICSVLRLGVRQSSQQTKMP